MEMSLKPSFETLECQAARVSDFSLTKILQRTFLGPPKGTVEKPYWQG